MQDNSLPHELAEELKNGQLSVAREQMLELKIECIPCLTVEVDTKSRRRY